jgi:hypothetical protein
MTRRYPSYLSSYGTRVSTSSTNDDRGIVTTPEQHVHPETVQELLEIQRDEPRDSSPVRPMGSRS